MAQGLLVARMIKKLFTISIAVLALNLFPLPTDICAVGITINPTTLMSSSAVGIAVPPVEDIFQPTSSDQFAVNTSAVSGLSTANAAWNFVNTNASAAFSGTYFLSALGTEGSTISARAYTLFDFTLTEAVAYSISGNLTWSIFSEGQSAIGEISASLLTGTAIPPGDVLYFDQDFPTTEAPVELDNAGLAQGSNTGTLEAGFYRFIFSSEIRNGLGARGNGGFNLTLTAPPGPTPAPVPEAASTIMLMCMALCGIARFARKA
jgi:hypothetical protein